MVDFAVALTAISQAVNVVKGLNQIDREFDKAELKLKIAELSSALATAQMTLAEAQKEFSEKDGQIGRLEAAFREKQELVEYRGFYYRKASDGTPLGRPYCPRCVQEGSLFMMTRTPKAQFACPKCRVECDGVTAFRFEDSRQREAEASPVERARP